jgi:mannosyl-oligosaccharide alpha-1,2-mannosidase
MFFRYRRYRVFLAAAVICVFLVIRFTQPAQWDATTAPIRDHLGLHGSFGSGARSSKDADDTRQKPLPNAAGDKIRPPPLPEVIPKPVQKVPPNRQKKPSASPTGSGLTSTSAAAAAVVATSTNAASTNAASKNPVLGVGGPDDTNPIPQPWNGIAENRIDDLIKERPEGRWDQSGLPTEDTVRWTKMPEHYPVPTESLKHLPTGKPKKIPAVQFKFSVENPEAKADRERKLEVIKDHFLHAWKGYKDHAWGSDELRPVSGGSKNTFNGWAATLVDSLDTMWMMGLKPEFEEAVEFVSKIDFKTSARSSIPVFETVIRYLGGLVGAYDVSGGQYHVLLEKAVELGDVLMGTFDTPNRMPQTYYQWKPYVSWRIHHEKHAKTN